MITLSNIYIAVAAARLQSKYFTDINRILTRWPYEASITNTTLPREKQAKSEQWPAQSHRRWVLGVGLPLWKNGAGPREIHHSDILWALSTLLPPAMHELLVYNKTDETKIRAEDYLVNLWKLSLWFYFI